MKALRAAIAILLGAGMAWAAQSKPVNDMCPVKTDKAVNPAITTDFKGKTVAFCCNNCKGLFEADPGRFASKVGPQPRAALNSISDALKAGKEGTKPAAILFMDATEKSKTFAAALGDKDLDESFAQVTYAAVVFERGDADAKKFSVTSAPSLVLVDPTGETPKVLKTLTSAAPKALKTEIENAVKKVTKK